MADSGGIVIDLAAARTARAEAARLSATQDQLARETLQRSRNVGIRSLLGSLGNGRFSSLLGSG